MGSFIAKQPNGLYCRFSSVVGCPTHYNMTEQDYIGMRGEAEARDVLEHYLQPFSEVLDQFAPNNMTRKEFNALLKEMGYKKRGTKP